jgi:CPA1 family monovalent cation:H+ antiporter
MDIHMLVFGLAGLLVLTCFLSPLAGLLRIPYTLLLSVVGALLGYLVHAHAWAPAWLGDYLEVLRAFEVPSETILVVFLPVLLFESALAMNVRRLLSDITPIMLLAVVAVFICTLFVGFSVSLITSYGIAACLLLGAVIATTDPAAVMGIFKEVGAPKRLTTIVEGESLLNDAAAIALFSVLLGIASHSADATWGAGNLLKNFAYLLFGGAIAGYLIGRLACAALPLLRGWPTAEISLTLATAYVAYIVPEHYFDVSGVVSTVVAGLVVSAVGRTRITPTTFYAMAESWRQFGFWASSLIFLFAAMMIPRLLVHATWQHIAIVLVMMLAALLARVVTVFGLLPLLTAAVGTKIDNRYKTVICWGGLRGALSLALALAVTEHGALDPSVSEFVAIGATGFVLATLLVNGLTLRPLIRLLDLDKLTMNERALRNQALALTVSDLQQETERIAVDEQISRQARQKINAIFETSVHSNEDIHLHAFSESERIGLGLSMVAKREFELFFQGLRDQGFDPKTAERLLAMSERTEDAIKSHGLAGFRQAMLQGLGYPKTFRPLLYLHQFLGVQALLGRVLSQRFVELVGIRWVTRRLLTFSDKQIRAMIGDSATQAIRSALKERLGLVEENLQAMRLQYPRFAEWTEENYLGKLARALERGRYRQMLSDSIITGEVYDALIEQLEQRWHLLEQQAPLDMELSPNELIHRVPLLSALPDQAARLILKSLKTRLVLPNELIQGQQKPNRSLYFVASGAVSVLLPDATHIELGSGEFFGELYLLKQDTSVFEVRSLGYTKLLELSAREFKSLLTKNDDIRQAIEGVAAERLRALEVWRSQLDQPTPAN